MGNLRIQIEPCSQCSVDPQACTMGQAGSIFSLMPGQAMVTCVERSKPLSKQRWNTSLSSPNRRGARSQLESSHNLSIVCTRPFNRVESPCCSDPRSLKGRNPKARRTSPLRLWQRARVRAETLTPPFAECDESAFWKGDGSRLAVCGLGLSPKSNRGFGFFVFGNP